MALSPIAVLARAISSGRLSRVGLRLFVALQVRCLAFRVVKLTLTLGVGLPACSLVSLCQQQHGLRFLRLSPSNVLQQRNRIGETLFFDRNLRTLIGDLRRVRMQPVGNVVVMVRLSEVTVKTAEPAEQVVRLVIIRRLLYCQR